MNARGKEILLKFWQLAGGSQNWTRPGFLALSRRRKDSRESRPKPRTKPRRPGFCASPEQSLIKRRLLKKDGHSSVQVAARW